MVALDEINPNKSFMLTYKTTRQLIAGTDTISCNRLDVRCRFCLELFCLLPSNTTASYETHSLLSLLSL